MKPIYVLFVTFFCIVGTLGVELQCKVNYSKETNWLDMKSECAKQLQSQIKQEIGAALTYLSMGAHFAKPTNYRPGFSKFFFEAANEEREHAIKIIEYLLMRGQLIGNETQILDSQERKDGPWYSGVQTLKEALKLETKVTKSIRHIIEKCENVESFNDYHLVDYLTTDFLDEQYKGQRDLAGKISTLNKMMGTHGPLGEFLFDKKLLNGEV